MTREEAIANHRKLWNWIAEEIKKRKEVVLKDVNCNNKLNGFTQSSPALGSRAIHGVDFI